MSRPVNINETLTFAPTSNVSTTNMTASSSYPAANGYTDASSTTYARFSVTRYATGSTYYVFSVTGIPSGATISSVSCVAKIYVYSTTNVTNTQIQLYSGTTAKGTSGTFATTTATTVTLNGGTWTAAELENARLYFKGTGAGNNNSSRYIYFYGATLTVVYSLQGTEYEVTSTLATNAVSSIDPAGQTYIREGENYELSIYADSIDNFKVEDNGQIVNGSLVQHIISANGTIQKAPASYTVSGSISGTKYQSAIGHTHDNPSTQTGNDYASSSGSTAYIDYAFDFSDIPAGATITSISVIARGHLESTSNSSEKAEMRLYSGSTAKGSAISFTSTSNSNVTISDTGTWTRDELQSAKLRFTIGYYGGLITGITWTVNYSTGDSDTYYWTYSLSNIQADHTIIISDSIIEIPEEDPQYDYYPITISSINATTEPGRGTTRVVEGTNQTITIYPSDPLVTLVTDNGVDISNQLVQHGNAIPDPIVATASGASYGFNLNNSTGYYVSQNAGVGSTAAVCRVTFNLPVRCLVTIQYINSGEETYDFGVFGKVDTTLSTSGWTSSSYAGDTTTDAGLEQLRCNTSAYNSTSAKTLTYEIQSGTHYIDIKYGKDQSSDSGNDSLQWKVLSIEPLEANNYYTYTLSNIQEAHSLIFIFGDVTYYFVNADGTGAKLFPSGSMVQLPGDYYLLTIVPDDYSYNVTVTDNNTDVTSQVQRKEEEITKEGNTYTVVNYIYKLNNIQATHNIFVQCSGNNALYIKISNNWVQARRVYVKVSGAWREVQDYSTLFDPNEIYVSGN